MFGDHSLLLPTKHVPRIFDTAVRALTNGKEREARDWQMLFAEADSRFKVLSITKPPMSSLGIIVAQWEG